MICFWGSCFGFRVSGSGFLFRIQVWDSGFGFRFGILVRNTVLEFKSGIQVWNSGFGFKFQFMFGI